MRQLWQLLPGYMITCEEQGRAACSVLLCTTECLSLWLGSSETTFLEEDRDLVSVTELFKGPSSSQLLTSFLGLLSMYFYISLLQRM